MVWTKIGLYKLFHSTSLLIGRLAQSVVIFTFFSSVKLPQSSAIIHIV